MGNEGYGDLTISDMRLAGDPSFDLITEVTLAAVPSTVELIVGVDFYPDEAGLCMTEFVIESDDPDHPFFSVPVSGIGLDGTE